MKLSSGCFYGNTLKSRSIGGFSLTETIYAPNQLIPKHAHECAYFCFVLGGAYTETYESRTRKCKTSSLIFHPPDERHSDRFDNAGGRCFNIQMDPQLLARVREHSMILDRPAEFRRPPLAYLATKLYREFKTIDDTSALVIEGLTLEILGEGSRQSLNSSQRQPPRWLAQAREMLHADFPKNPSLRLIASFVGVHPVHLARGFRQHYRCTVGEYVRQLRIEFASRELSRSDTPLVEIAAAAGFCSQSHFSTLFKRYTSFTPAEYRAISRPR
jgi:AraC family transcriptional regulator